MNITLHMVITPEKPEVLKEVQSQLRAFEPALSFSPARPEPGTNDCLEFYATAKLDKEKAQSLKAWLDNDWDGEEDEFWCYGFNTRPFNPHVYYMRMEMA